MAISVRSFVLLALFTAIFVTATPPAFAQTDDYARLSQAGIAASMAGRHEEAYALFQQAHAASPSARSLRLLGATAFQLRRYSMAIQHYVASLADGRRPLTPEQRTQAEGELTIARSLVGRVHVTTATPGATATIDGDEIALDVNVVLDPGAHELVVRAAGYLEQRRSFTTRGAEERRFDLRLDPQVTANTTNTTNTTNVIESTRERAGAASPDTGIDPVVDASQRPNAETSADTRFVVGGAIALGVGIAGLGVGIGAQLIGQDAINQWNASQVPAGLCSSEGNPGRPPANDPADCIALYDRWSNAQPWVYVGYVAGGLLTVTGIVLLLIAPQVPVSGGTTLACGGGPGEIGVACSGTF